MGREAFIVLYSLVYNRTYINPISALPNSRANRLAFINIDYTKDIIKFIGCTTIRLDRLIVVKGYSSVRSNAITEYLLINLLINGQQLVDIPFLILDLRNYNIILEAK
jgi:hypothetical protein